MVSSEMSSIGTLDRNKSDQRRLRALSPRNAVWLESKILARSRRWMKTIWGALETDWRHHREQDMSSSCVYVSANQQIREALGPAQKEKELASRTTGCLENMGLVSPLWLVMFCGRLEGADAVIRTKVHLSFRCVLVEVCRVRTHILEGRDGTLDLGGADGGAGNEPTNPPLREKQVISIRERRSRGMQTFFSRVDSYFKNRATFAAVMGRAGMATLLGSEATMLTWCCSHHSR
jgi:hypothetical protein